MIPDVTRLTRCRLEVLFMLSLLRARDPTFWCIEAVINVGPYRTVLTPGISPRLSLWLSQYPEGSHVSWRARTHESSLRNRRLTAWRTPGVSPSPRSSNLAEGPRQQVMSFSTSIWMTSSKYHRQKKRASEGCTPTGGDFVSPTTRSRKGTP